MSKPSTSPTRAKTGEGATAPHPHAHHPEPDDEADGNDASTLIEKPAKPGDGGKLKQHSFPDGGGSGGAEAFRRLPRQSGKAPGRR